MNTFRVSFTRSARQLAGTASESLLMDVQLSTFLVPRPQRGLGQAPAGRDRNGAVTDASRELKAGASLHLQDLSGALVLTWALGLPTLQEGARFLMRAGGADGLKSPEI